MKILIVTPLHNGYIDTLTERTIKELDIPEHTVVDYFRPSYGYTTVDVNGVNDKLGRNNLLEKYQQARILALAGNYDYMLTIESDNVVPRDTITKLLSCDSDVAYGLYVFGRFPFLNSCWLGIDEYSYIGYPLSSFPKLMHQYKYSNNKIIDSDGVGFGCTLIKRHVLEAIDFRVRWLREDGTQDDNPSHNDIPFSVDCIKHGFTQRHNLDVLVGHVKPYNEIGLPIKSVIMPTFCDIELHRKSYYFVDYQKVLNNL